jgi:hypothetical protein
MTIRLGSACHELILPISIDHQAGVRHWRCAHRKGSPAACATLVG